MTVRYTNLPDNKDKAFGGAYSVHDEFTVNHMNWLIREFTPTYKHNPDEIREDFLNVYRSWMPSTHKLHGLEKYTEACFTQGTTESFAQFHQPPASRRVEVQIYHYFRIF